jgi:alkaline phosphatase D
MKKHTLILLTSLTFFTLNIFAQKGIVSGPMLGYIEHREALIWLEVAPEVTAVSIKYQEQGKPQSLKTAVYEGILGKRYNPIKIQLEELDMNTVYEYSIFLNDKKAELPFATTFKTKKLWEWREAAPDFSFLLGSCFYINDPTYDRPGKPYGQDPRILETMANMPSDFMLWMGDNLYLREADYSSEAGIAYRYSYNFRQPQFQKLRATRANYAIWDDHDYGSDNSDNTFELKNYTLDIFKKYWGNKSYGEPDNAGIYHKFHWSDCDFFMMDDRYYRAADDMPELVDGKPNPNKPFYGRKQMEWLKNSLINSTASFKFIVSGGQMLNPMAKDKECFLGYPAEWQELMSFITQNKIGGIIFITGDRHYSELIKYQQADFYPLYEFTCSSVTAGVADISKTKEFTNPDRVAGSLLMQNNFGKISVGGDKENRQVTLETYDKAGMKKWNFTIKKSDLKVK